MADEILNIDDFFPKDLNSELQKINRSLDDTTKSVQDLINTAKKGVKLDIEIELEKIQRATKDQKEQQRVIKESAKAIDDLADAQKALNQTQKVAETQNDAAKKSIAQLKDELKQAKMEYDQLTASQRDNSEIGKQLRTTITTNTKLIKNLGDAARNQALDFDKSTASYREVSDRLRALKKELKEIPGSLDRSSAAYRQNATRVNDLEQEIAQLDQELKGFDKTIGESFRNVGNYGDALQGLGGVAGDLKGGFGGLVQTGGAQGFTGIIQGGVGAVGKFLPQIAIATGAIAALTEGFQALNETIVETNRELNIVQQLLGLTGDSAEEARVGIAALTKTFDVEFTEATQAANILVTDFGLNFDDALSLIEQGLLRGANANGDFLDQIREYGPQFADAQFSAEALINTIGSAVETGAFSDKAADAVKEFGLRFRELTPAAKDAIDAFDDLTKAQILNAQAAGNTEEGLRLVLEGLQSGQLTVQEFQTVIADLFGGPGEDLGRERLLGLLESTQFLSDELTELEAANERVLKSNQAVEEAQGKLTAEFKGTSAGLEALGNNIKAALIDRLTVVIQVIKEAFAPLGEFINQVQELVAEILPEGVEQFDFFEASLQLFRTTLRILLSPLQLLGFILTEVVKFVRAARDQFLEWIEVIQGTTAFQFLSDTISFVVEKVNDFVDGVIRWAETTPIVKDVLNFFRQLGSAIAFVVEGIADLIFGIEEAAPDLGAFNTVLSAQISGQALDVSEGKKNVDKAVKELLGQLGESTKDGAAQALFKRFGTDNKQAILNAVVRTLNDVGADPEAKEAARDILASIFEGDPPPLAPGNVFEEAGKAGAKEFKETLEEEVDEDEIARILQELELEGRDLRLEAAINAIPELDPANAMDFGEELAMAIQAELDLIEGIGELVDPANIDRGIQQLQRIVDAGGVNADAAAQQIEVLNQRLRDEFQRTFQNIFTGITSTGQALSGLLSGISQLFQQQIDEQEAVLEQVRERNEEELESFRGNEEAQEAIRERQAEEEARREEQINRLRVKQARFEKAAGITSAIINTSIGVTKALASLPPPFSFITAALTAAQGAIQIALISRQKVPQFAEGTEGAPGGLAIVGEEGSELMVTPSGQLVMTPDEASLVDLERGTKIFTARETENIVNNLEGDLALDKEVQILPVSNEELISDLITKRDQDVLDAIDNQRMFVFNMTRRSIEMWSEHKGQKTQYFNERYGK